MKAYTLIITEKPDAARRIAAALDTQGKANKKEKMGVPYYKAERKEKIVVVSALGHLYTVASKKRVGRDYPVFDFHWVPRYLAEHRASRIRTWLKVISKLAKNADKFVDACDYDLEGSIIGYSILKYACGGKENDALRLKYSTLTKEELEKCYSEPLSHLDFALIEAGLTRHEVDWLYGINLSRALTTATKNYSGKYTTISTGRVQGPTLKFLETRERSIRFFVPTPYWSIKAEVKIGSRVYESEYEKDPVETKAEAEAIIESCQGRNGKIGEIAMETSQHKPPLPFDLGSLQREAYRLFGCTPIHTSNILQRLYLSALISYPRTNSQKLPPEIGYEKILKKLSIIPEYKKEAYELLRKPALKPTEGKKKDPAHPAIFPTGNPLKRSLNNVERNIWDLVVRRFMAAFSHSAIKQSVRVIININGKTFQLKRRRTLEEGWLSFYKPYVKSVHNILSPIKIGQKIIVTQLLLEEKFTTPPARYNPSSLLKRMEKEMIGTKATRAGIIQTLNNRKYTRGEEIVVTELGLELADVLSDYCPAIVSLDLTRELEKRMNYIQQGEETRENILKDTIEALEPVAKQLKEEEYIIGMRLCRALMKTRLEERVIGICPLCKKGNLIIVRSRTSGKRFIGCTNFFDGTCKASFPIPQKGLVESTGIICRNCSSPIVKIWIKDHRYWNLCINPSCSTKTEEKKG